MDLYLLFASLTLELLLLLGGGAFRGLLAEDEYTEVYEGFCVA